MWLATTVHTSGINWETVGTLIGSIIAAVTLIFGFFARYISNRITASIDRFRIDVIAKMDTRLTVLEEIVGRNKRSR
jgi:hypothetical protein